MQHRIREEITGVLVFVGVVWIVFLLDWILPIDFNAYGLTPRNWTGLAGIVTMPFLHANFEHLLSNTAPLLVLLVLLAGSRTQSSQVVVSIILLGGSLLWIFGRPAIHVGASGLIFGLIAFLITSGLLERRVVPLLIAVLVGLLYGSTLITGVLPSLQSNISWDGHLTSAIAGAIVAFLLARPARRTGEISVE